LRNDHDYYKKIIVKPEMNLSFEQNKKYGN